MSAATLYIPASFAGKLERVQDALREIGLEATIVTFPDKAGLCPVLSPPGLSDRWDSSHRHWGPKQFIRWVERERMNLVVVTGKVSETHTLFRFADGWAFIAYSGSPISLWVAPDGTFLRANDPSMDKGDDESDEEYSKRTGAKLQSVRAYHFRAMPWTDFVDAMMGPGRGMFGSNSLILRLGYRVLSGPETEHVLPWPEIVARLAWNGEKPTG